MESEDLLLLPPIHKGHTELTLPPGTKAVACSTVFFPGKLIRASLPNICIGAILMGTPCLRQRKTPIPTSKAGV